MQKRPISDVRDRRRERNNRMYVLSRVRTNRVSLYNDVAQSPTVVSNSSLEFACVEFSGVGVVLIADK